MWYSLKKLSFLLLLFGLCIVSKAQEKPGILVVPFPHYQFVSNYDLLKVMEVNQLKVAEELVPFLLDSLNYYLCKTNKHYNLSPISENDYQGIQHLIQPLYKVAPTGHYGVEIDPLLRTGQYESLCKSFKVEYLLFLTQYTISNGLKKTGGNFDGPYIIPWASHHIDYELYNSEGELVALASGLELNGIPPNNQNVETDGLLIADLRGGFRAILKDLVAKIEQYKKTKKPVYKLKKKKN